MLRKVLHNKIHGATVTKASVDYMGSITIDPDLMDAVDLRVSDAVTVVNCNNGNRLETYVFRGEPGQRQIEINGAAALLMNEGDTVIILHYALMTDNEYAEHHPKVALMNPDNTINELINYEPSATPLNA
ncbi:MAG: aspartate 1-decarboxylase [Planctomycetota bacterium]